MNVNAAVRSSVVVAGLDTIVGAGGRLIVQLYVRAGPVPVALRARTLNERSPYGSDP